MHDMSKVVQYLFLLEQTIAKNKRLSKSLHGVSLLRLPDVLERQQLSLNLLSKLVMSLILEKHLVVLEYFLASLKLLE